MRRGAGRYKFAKLSGFVFTTLLSGCDATSSGQTGEASKHPDAALDDVEDAAVAIAAASSAPLVSETLPSGAETPCNGLRELCAYTYGEPLQLMTHASAATRVAAWRYVSQSQSLADQMRSDVPALQLEIFEEEGQLYVCFDNCEDGRTLLSLVLADVRLYLESYIYSTLTLFLDLHVSAQLLTSAFAEAKLDQYHFIPNGRTLPTLGEMIDANTRLVVFANRVAGDEVNPAAAIPSRLTRKSLDGGAVDADAAAFAAATLAVDALDAGTIDATVEATSVPGAIVDAAVASTVTIDVSEAAAPPLASAGNASGEPTPSAQDASTADWPAWLLHTDDWVRQTDPSPDSPGDISCQTVRGAADAPLLLLHLHAPDLETGLPEEATAERINGPEFLLDRLDQCSLLHGRRPSFVAVDFVTLGLPQTTILSLNLGQPVITFEPDDTRDLGSGAFSYSVHR